MAYKRGVHVVVESPDFAADAKAAGLDAGEVRRIIEHLARRPDAGDVIQGTGGARKVRFAGRGKGKGGGYRVITFYSGAGLPVFLLTVFGKGRKVDLTQAERNELRKELAGLVEDYRKGVRLHVRSR
ncbi:MAG: type II toxin-antitoxin system RelE/ParE family toxin [Geminicoccaceae bacterium]